MIFVLITFVLITFVSMTCGVLLGLLIAFWSGV